MDAARPGDLATLEDLLAEDVVSYSDAGGAVRATRIPVVSAVTVAKYVRAFADRFWSGAEVRWSEVNGQPPAVVSHSVGVGQGRPPRVLAEEPGQARGVSRPSPGYPAGMKRPGPVRWLHYVYGGVLPEEYREWVLYDATAKTWVLRFAFRIFAEALPWLIAGYVVLALVTPMPAGMIVAALLISLLLSLFLTVTSADELAEVRLTKHGFPPGTGKEVRKRRGGASTWP